MLAARPRQQVAPESYVEIVDCPSSPTSPAGRCCCISIACKSSPRPSWARAEPVIWRALIRGMRSSVRLLLGSMQYEYHLPSERRCTDW